MPHLSDLSRVPFPVAYPLHWARDPDKKLQIADRWKNAVFTTYQAMKLTALLLLADYLESDITDPRLAPLIRGLRFPHWQEWSHLADGLARFWTAQDNKAQSRFPELAAGWMSVSRVKPIGAGRKETALDPIWAGRLDGFDGVGGLPTARSANDAIWAARNRAAHREATITPEFEERQGEEFRRLLPLVETMVATLFEANRFELLRAVPKPGLPTQVIQLHGPHADLSFVARPLDPAWADALRTTEIAALVGDDAIAIYPLFVPLQDEGEATPPTGFIEPVAMIDGVNEARLTVLGVRHSGSVKGEHLAAALARLRAKHADLLIGRDEAAPWTVVSWAAMSAAQTLDDIRDRKYFPRLYVERPDMDAALPAYAPVAGRALLLLGDAGSGKSSLLARFVDGMVGESGELGAVDRVSQATGETQHIVAFLTGRADYGTTRADISGAELLADAVGRKLGIRDGTFASLADLVLHLATNRQDHVDDRAFWIVLDGVNEADRFLHLVRAIDEFLPSLALAPRTRLAISMRSGAFFALGSRDELRASHGAGAFSNAHCFVPFTNAQDKTHPWLEIRPFRPNEAAEAYERRRHEMGSRAAGISFDRLPQALASIITSPLYMHLFHEIWAGRTDVPADLDESALLDRYLNRLEGRTADGAEGRIAGIGPWLDRLGDLMLDRRAPILPMAVADEWAEEWRRQLGFASIDLATKLDPIEELAAASVLLRPAEAGFGAARERIGYQFAHQKLAERVLLRALDRRIAPRAVPSREELLNWAEQAAGMPAFPELTGALGDWVRRLVIISAGETLDCLLDIADDSTQRPLMAALIFACARAPDGAAARILDRLAAAATTHADGRDRYLISCWSPTDQLAERAPIGVMLPLYRAFLHFTEALAQQDPTNIEFQRDVSVSCNKLGDLALRTGQPEPAAGWFKRDFDIAEALAQQYPANVEFQRDLSVSCNKLGDLALRTGQPEAAAGWFKRGFDIVDALTQQDPTNIEFQRDLSISCDRLGDLALRAGQPEAAAGWFKRDCDIAEALTQQDPANVGFQRDLSVSCDRLGDLALRAGQPEAAAGWFKRGFDIRDALAQQDPANVEFQRNLSVSCDRLGDLALRAGQPEAAAGWFKRGFDIRDALAQQDPANVGFQRDLSFSCDGLGDLALRAGQLEAAAGWFKRGFDIRDALAQQDPANVEFQSDLSVSCNKLGDLALRTGQPEAAAGWFKRGLDIAEALAQQDPANVGFQRDLSVSCNKLGDLALRTGQPEAAAGWFKRGLDIAEALAQQDPANVGFQRDLSVSCDKLGDLALRTGQPEAAAGWFKRGFDIAETLAQQDPANVGFQHDLSVSCDRLGDLALRAGQPEAAAGWFKRGFDIAETLAQQDPANVGFQRNLSVSCDRLGDLALRTGQPEAAAGWFKRGFDIAETLAQQDPANVGFQHDLSVSCDRLGDLALRAGQPEAAAGWFKRGFDIAETLAQQDPANVGFQHDLSVSCDRLGDLALRAGQPEAATGWFKRGFDIRDALAQQDPANVEFQRDLSISCNKLGDLALQRGQIKQAVRHLERAHDIASKLLAVTPDDHELRSLAERAARLASGTKLLSRPVLRPMFWMLRMIGRMFASSRRFRAKGSRPK